MIRNILIAVITVASLLAVSCSNGPVDSGTIQGRVTIGPLVPVERPGVTYEVPCEVYEARKIVVYKQNGKDLVRELTIDCEGGYQAELRPGFYVIDISRTGIDRSSDVPAEIEIRPLETVVVDIDIDTGIR